MNPADLRFAVMTHPRVGRIFLEMLVAAKLKPAVVVTQDPFFIPRDRPLRWLRQAKRQVQYALHRAHIQQRHQAYFTAKRHGVATLPAQIANTEQAARALQALNLDYIFVFGFEILKAMIYTIPRHGSINCHTAYLPSHRGRDPVFWTVNNREAYTGVTYHYIDAGIDTGKVIAQYKIPLCELDDAIAVGHRLQSIGARKFTELIYRLALGLPMESVVEPDIKASYDKPAQRSDRYLRADLTADEVAARIRASRGYGEAWLTIDNSDVEVIDAIPLSRLPATAASCQRAEFDACRNVVYRAADGRLLYLITKTKPS